MGYEICIITFVISRSVREQVGLRVRVMVFNAIFNSISILWWRSQYAIIYNYLCNQCLWPLT